MDVVIKGKYAGRMERKIEKSGKMIYTHQILQQIKTKTGFRSDLVNVADFNDQTRPEGSQVEIDAVLKFKLYNGQIQVNCITFEAIRDLAPQNRGAKI